MTEPIDGLCQEQDGEFSQQREATAESVKAQKSFFEEACKRKQKSHIHNITFCSVRGKKKWLFVDVSNVFYIIYAVASATVCVVKYSVSTAQNAANKAKCFPVASVRLSASAEVPPAKLEIFVLFIHSRNYHPESQ